jgi:uncharacterized protein YndB with AHSA1/START domain
MTKPVRLERQFAVPVDRVFDYVTRADLLMQWWGPEGIARYMVSGQVTSVRRHNLVAFTWGWHDDNDRRGHESHVVIELSEAENGGTRFVLTHHDLPDQDQKNRHAEGWISSLRKLAAAL